MQKNRNIQLIFAVWAELKPESGKEGNISRTTSFCEAVLSVLADDHGISIRTYKKDDKDEKRYIQLQVSVI